MPTLAKLKWKRFYGCLNFNIKVKTMRKDFINLEKIDKIMQFNFIMPKNSFFINFLIEFVLFLLSYKVELIGNQRYNLLLILMTQKPQKKLSKRYRTSSHYMVIFFFCLTTTENVYKSH